MTKDSTECALVLDVGGTTIDGGVVTADLRLVGDVKRVESPISADAGTILATLNSLLLQLKAGAENSGMIPAVCAVGIPGLFDYENGISRMEHIYQAINGVNLKKEFEELLKVPAFFLNDAAAYGHGVRMKEYPNEERLILVTIGTRLGSTLFDQESIVPQKPGHEIGDFSYKGQELADSVSRGAIERYYVEEGGEGEVDVKDIADRARHGDAAAIGAFRRQGNALGEGLALATRDFQPTRIVCGGQISKAFDLFGKVAEEAYEREAGQNAPFAQSVAQYPALLGAAAYAFKML